ncbi:TSC22 domain family protein 2 isoform X2 [Kryptolebias marmoratus]|uniref:TSC22 domain family member 2 n=1 Tax=Kryptolebias marmoratus TaxID=37003 RepID=A0A3Q2ZSB2_KRYMA|nr:TSC22 domain family protein 2 isoform X2 [Kryptolebias marmoratus]
MEDKLRHSAPNMSKMPAKKKSCFQITSVTQAQVAAVGAADDTESLDDPDESRTEDVSSEIYDVSRAEYEPACDRSSSEEALNNVGEAEVVSAPQAGQSGEGRKAGVSGSSQGGQNPPGPGGSVNASAAVTSSAPTSTVSCSSRFRVIKLDHGTGEPFRRGRWTCTEFYEKDSEASLGGRTVDSIRHPTVTQDPAADRDSGLGPSGGSVVSPLTHSGPSLGSMAEASLSSSRLHSAETLPPPQQQVLHQSYPAASATHTSFSGIKPTAAPAPPTVGLPQPHLAQNVLPVGQNGLSHPDVHLQKSPIMPPSYAPQQQVPLGHLMPSQSSGLMQHQAEYYQQQQPTAVPAALSGVQSLPVSSLSVGAVGQGPAPVLSPASGAASVPSQVGDVSGAPGGSVTVGQPALVALQLQQTIGFGGPGASILVAGSGLPPQTAGQFPATGQPQPLASGVQNVPAMAVGSSVPAAVLSASSAAMPNVTTSSLPPGQMTHSITPMALGVQGLPATGFGQAEGAGCGRKSEGIINAQSPVVSGRDMMKPFMPETLNLNTPTVNSLFGIHIPVDGEEDSASGANIVAIDNKIEQAMDLVKSHLMYAVREEVEVLKEQIKELFERNSVLERENAVLKSLANNEQLSQLSSQTVAAASGAAPLPQPQGPGHPQLQPHPPKPQQLQTPQADGGQQPNVTSA